MGCSGMSPVAELENPGDSPIGVVLSLTGAGSGVFQIDGQMSFELPPHTSRTLQIRFCPAIPPGPGMMEAQFEITGSGSVGSLALKAYVAAGN